MHEDHRASRRKDQIGAARQILAVQAEAKAERVQTPAHQELRFRILAADSAHVELPLRRRQHVGPYLWPGNSGNLIVMGGV